MHCADKHVFGKVFRHVSLLVNDALETLGASARVRQSCVPGSSIIWSCSFVK